MSPPAQAGPSASSSSSISPGDHPLIVLSETVLTAPLTARRLEQTEVTLSQRIRQVSFKNRAIRRLDTLRTELASSLEASKPGSATPELTSFAERYASGLSTFEQAWDQAGNASSAGVKDEIWSKLPTFAAKVVVSAMRAILLDPFRTGQHLSSLGAAIFADTPVSGDQNEAELVLGLVSSLVGPKGVLKLAEGYAVGLIQELVGDETSPSHPDSARQRELESSFVTMMGLVHDLGLEVDASSGSPMDGGIARTGSPFAFTKSLELVLLEALTSPEPTASDSSRPTSRQAQRPPQRHAPSISSAGTSSSAAFEMGTGWGATFSSMLFSPPSTPGPSADFPWATRGGWVPAGTSGGPSGGEPTLQRKAMDTRSISGPSPILKSPLGRMFRSPSLSSSGSSSLADSSATRPFTTLAASILRLLSRPSSEGPPSATLPSKTPLIQALAISLLRTHFPFATHPRSHRRILLLLVIRFYSFQLLRRVLTGSAVVPPLPLPYRGVCLTSVQGSAPEMEFAGSGASKGRGPLLVDVWKGDLGEGKLDKLHLRVHLALVEAAGFGGAGATSSARSGGSSIEQEEEELSRAAKRLLEAFGAGIPLASSSHPEETVAVGLEVDTLNTLKLDLDEVLSLLRLTRPLVAFSTSLGSLGQAPGGVAGFRRGSDFKGGTRLTAPGLGRWGTTSTNESVLSEEDFDAVQAGLARLVASPMSPSIIAYTSPTYTQGSFTVSLSIPDVERTPHQAFLTPSPPLGRTLGSHGATPRANGSGTRRGSTASLHSPTMSPSFDGGTGADYFALDMVLEDPTEAGDVGRVEKEVVFRALVNLIKDGHLTTMATEAPPDLLALLTRAAVTAEDAFDFANALSYRQAIECLSKAVKTHPHLAQQNFTRLLAPLVSSAVAAETIKVARLELVQTRLLEVDQKDSTLLLAARRLLSALHDLRTRAHFALEILSSERVAELQTMLSEIKSGQVDLNEDGAVSSWLSEINLASELLDEPTLHASCYLVDRVLRQITDPEVLFRSPLWAREAALARPFLQTTSSVPSPAPSTDATSAQLSCLSFGAISTSLLRPGEPPTAQLPYLTTFILRLRTRLTGFLLAELEARGDLSFPDEDWLEREWHHLPTPEDGPAPDLPTAWTSPLLQTFLLHPSPHAKLQALFALELLCVSKKTASFSPPPLSGSVTPGLPPSMSLASVKSTATRHSGRSPCVSSSPTLDRISKAIDNHPQSSSPVAAGSAAAVIPDAFWSLGASLSSLVFGGPATATGPSVGGGQLAQVREASTVEPPSTDELVHELSGILVRHRPKNLPASLAKIAFFVPGEILDFKPDGKAFLDFGLACLTLRADLLDILHIEAKEIVRKGGYATKEERARAIELLDLCAKEGNDEAKTAVNSFKTPWSREG